MLRPFRPRLLLCLMRLSDSVFLASLPLDLFAN